MSSSHIPTWIGLVLVGLFVGIIALYVYSATRPPKPITPTTPLVQPSTIPTPSVAETRPEYADAQYQCVIKGIAITVGKIVWDATGRNDFDWRASHNPMTRNEDMWVWNEPVHVNGQKGTYICAAAERSGTWIVNATISF